MGLQFEFIATNRSCNHHCTHLGQNSVAGRQAPLLQIFDEHTVMRCSLLDTKGCELMPTNPRCSGQHCQYCDSLMSVLLLRSQYNYVRLVCALRILVKRWGFNPYLFNQSMSLQTEVATTIPHINSSQPNFNFSKSFSINIYNPLQLQLIIFTYNQLHLPADINQRIRQ